MFWLNRQFKIIFTVALIAIISVSAVVWYAQIQTQQSKGENNAIQNISDQFFKSFSDINNNTSTDGNNLSTLPNLDSLVKIQQDQFIIDAYSSYKIATMIDGTEVYRFPNDILTQTTKDKIYSLLRKTSSAVTINEHVFLYKENQLYFTGMNLFYLADFKYGEQIYWFMVTNDSTSALNPNKSLAISKPFFNQIKVYKTFRSSEIIHASKKSDTGVFYVTIYNPTAIPNTEVYEVSVSTSIKDGTDIFETKQFLEDANVTR